MRIRSSGTMEAASNERITIHITTFASPCLATLSTMPGNAWSVSPRRTEHLLLAQLAPSGPVGVLARFPPSGPYRVTIRGNPHEDTYSERVQAPGVVSRTYQFALRDLA